MTGSSLVAQNGRECLLGPGTFSVYESVAPNTLLFDEGADHRFFRFPRAALALPERLLRHITAVSLGSDNPIARLALTYFSQLAVSDDMHQGVHAHAAVQPSVELLRAVLNAELFAKLAVKRGGMVLAVVEGAPGVCACRKLHPCSSSGSPMT